MGEQTRSGVSPASQLPNVTRRRLVTGLLGFSALATLGGVLTPIVGFLWPPVRVSTGGSGRMKIGSTADFPVGSGKVISVNDEPVIVANTAQAGIRAFSAICTHKGCIVSWEATRGFILCPCHNGRFNPITGAVTSGPPPIRLPQLELTVEGDGIFVRQG